MMEQQRPPFFSQVTSAKELDGCSHVAASQIVSRTCRSRPGLTCFFSASKTSTLTREHTPPGGMLHPSIMEEEEEINEPPRRQCPMKKRTHLFSVKTSAAPERLVWCLLLLVGLISRARSQVLDPYATTTSSGYSKTSSSSSSSSSSNTLFENSIPNFTKETPMPSPYQAERTILPTNASSTGNATNGTFAWISSSPPPSPGATRASPRPTIGKMNMHQHLTTYLPTKPSGSSGASVTNFPTARFSTQGSEIGGSSFPPAWLRLGPGLGQSNPYPSTISPSRAPKMGPPPMDAFPTYHPSYQSAGALSTTHTPTQAPKGPGIGGGIGGIGQQGTPYPTTAKAQQATPLSGSGTPTPFTTGTLIPSTSATAETLGPPPIMTNAPTYKRYPPTSPTPQPTHRRYYPSTPYPTPGPTPRPTPGPTPRPTPGPTPRLTFEPTPRLTLGPTPRPTRRPRTPRPSPWPPQPTANPYVYTSYPTHAAVTNVYTSHPTSNYYGFVTQGPTSYTGGSPGNYYSTSFPTVPYSGTVVYSPYPTISRGAQQSPINYHPPVTYVPTTRSGSSGPLPYAEPPSQNGNATSNNNTTGSSSSSGSPTASPTFSGPDLYYSMYYRPTLMPTNAAPPQGYSYPLVTLSGTGYKMLLHVAGRRLNGKSHRRLLNNTAPKSNCVDIWTQYAQANMVNELKSAISKIETLQVSIDNASMDNLKSSSALAVFFGVSVRLRSSGTPLTMDQLVAAQFNNATVEQEFISKLKSSACGAFANVTSVEVVLPTNSAASSTTQQVVKNGNKSKAGLIVGVVAAVAAAIMLMVLFVFMRWNGTRRDKVDAAAAAAAANGAASDDDKQPLADSDGNNMLASIGMRTPADVSVLSDPLPVESSGGSTIASWSLDYDFQKAYQSSVVSELSATPDAAALQNNMASADVENPENQFVFTEAQFEVLAPRGVLGLILETNDEGIPVVNNIKSSSVLGDQVQIGDKLLTVDGIDVSQMLASDVSKLIHSKRNQNERRLGFSRHIRLRFSEAMSSQQK